jgi:type I restriction-modification system DNA methylase subunit
MTSRSDRQRPPPDHQKELLKLFNALAYRHSAWQVFSDFNEAAAISVSNAIDRTQKETREARYMQLIQRYQKEELAKFPQMLAELTLALEDEPSDILGRTFHELELHNKWAGQFFSPYPLCRMMARMIADKEQVGAIIAERGFVRAAEPAVGSGAMVIAGAQELLDSGINYQQHFHVTATDIDAKCVHMAYLQLSLLHVPAVIVHGNSLSLEEHAHWYTPAHIMGGWAAKLKRTRAPDEKAGHEAGPTEPHPPQPVREEPSQPDAAGPSQLKLF